MKSKEQVVWEGKKVFLGIDVHQSSWTVTGVCEGEQILHRRIPASYEVLERQIKPYLLGGAKIAAVYEACGFGYKLYDQLKFSGIESYVTAPSTIPQAPSDRVKTDKRDSQKLAIHLSQGLLKMVPVPSADERIERALVRTRKQLVEQATGIKLRIKSILRFYGYTDRLGRWTKSYKDKLREASKRDKELEMVGVWLDLHEVIEEKIKEIEAKIATLSKEDRYNRGCQKLMTIPGVGQTTAMTVLTELQGFKPFTSADKLASYVGLVPSEHSSGDRQRQGRITKTGNSRVRAALVEAAWILIIKDGVMRTHYQKIVCRNGNQRYAKQIAIVAVARKLLVRMYAIVQKDQSYAVGLVA